MPSFTISPSAYFDKIGPFERPFTRMVLLSVDGDGKQAAPLTTDPGDQWLSLMMSILGGRPVGLFGDAGIEESLAVLVRSTGTAVATLSKWIKLVRKTQRRVDVDLFHETPLNLWLIPRPFPPGMPQLLRDVSHMQTFADPLLMVDEDGTTFLEMLDPLFDLGAMYWRLFPGHLKLQLDTRFIGPRDLERHLIRTAQMAGVELWQTTV
ncbi:MAG: hypothetical protein H7338_18620 [Candidatus Sericytochromatia bacterium]|nr:hypothetical protein [Candidatus Sericytochromatia bacterium]